MIKKAGYCREITLLNKQVGKLRATIVKLGIAENTLFLYCSDNDGLVDATAGGLALKGSIYEGGLRVPAILEWLGTLAASKVPTPVYMSDIFPTKLALAGIEFDSPHPLDGIDASKIITGKQSKRSPIGLWHDFKTGQATRSDGIIRTLEEARETEQLNPLPSRFLKNVNEFSAFEAPLPAKATQHGSIGYRNFIVSKKAKVRRERPSSNSIT